MCRPLVDKVSNRFSSGTKERRGFNPTHGQNQGQCKELLFIGKSGQGHCKLSNSTGVELNAIKAIRQINFGEVNRTKTWVGVSDLVEYALQGTAKLHCLRWGQIDGISIDIIEGQINNKAWAAVALGHNTHWRDSQSQEMAKFL